MSDFPGPGQPPPFLHTWMGEYSGALDACLYTGTGIAAASVTWATANQARYIPVSFPWAYSVKRVFWVNGATVTGNMDFGIYNPDGTRIYSTGSTAQTGNASIPQFVTPTAFVLPPGDYYFAQNCSGTAGAAWGNAVAAEGQQFAGILQQAVGSVALPAAATFASASVAGIGLCGITSTTTTF